MKSAQALSCSRGDSVPSRPDFQRLSSDAIAREANRQRPLRMRGDHWSRLSLEPGATRETKDVICEALESRKGSFC